MADKESRSYNVGPFSYNPPPRTQALKKYFFLDGKLYRMDMQDRSGNVLHAWNFNDKKIEAFVLSDAKRRMKPAYNTREVALMLNRSHVRIQEYVNQGAINPPIKIYSQGLNAYGVPFSVMKWSEDDILALHTYLLTLPMGKPRKDGYIRAATRIPTRKELLAILRNQPMFYMRTSTGEMIPVWSAYDEV